MARLGPYTYSSPSMTFWLDYSYSQSVATNKTTVTVTIVCENGPSAYGDSMYLGAGSQYGYVEGVIEAQKVANPFLPDINGTAGTDRWSISGTREITHDAAGNHASVAIRHKVDYGNVHGDNSATLALPRIAKKPAQVITLTLSAPSTTGMNAAWSAPTDNGGSAITGYELKYSTDAGMAGAAVVPLGNVTSYDLAGLTPGTTYYVTVAAKNAQGTGTASSARAQATLPSVPPGFTVSSSPSGSQATLAFTPPGGVTGVTKYVWERRNAGTTTPVTPGETAVTTATVGGLTPGTVYEWRASAFIGTYQSPWTGWIALAQAKPNTTPGDYFDGSTVAPPGSDVTYSWEGAANGSASLVTGKEALGWATVFSSGAGVLFRLTAGLRETYAARVQITADSSAWGQVFGQRRISPYWTEVTPGAVYVGSIHVRPSRSQRMAAHIQWMDAAGTAVGAAAMGAGTVVDAAPTWTRLVISGIAPAGAVRAAVSAVDVTGAGWSIWLGGDTIDLDAAMISLSEEFPYFDGDTTDTAEYVYAWTGVANSSTSTRTPTEEASSPLLVLPDGTSVPVAKVLTNPSLAAVPSPPRPPTVPSDIEEVGVWRRYFATIPSTTVPDWMDVVPTLEITTGAYASQQIRVRYYPNPEELPPVQVPTSSWDFEQIVSYMPAASVLTIDGISQHAWVEVNGSDPISADHLLYGSNGKPPTWPVLSCNKAYLISVDVPTDEPEGNIDIDGTLTART